MGDRPHDQTPADLPGPRPPRSRPATSGRPQPAARTGRPRPTPSARPAGRAGARTGTATAPAARPARGRPATAGRRAAARSATAVDTGAAGTSRTASGSRRTGPPPERKGPSENTMVVVLSVLTVVVVSFVVWAVVFRAAGSVSPDAQTQTTTTIDAEAPGTTLAESAFSTYTSPEMGFTMKYPTAWTASKADDGELIVEVNDGDLVSARKFTRTEEPTTVENLINIKAVTDGIVGTNKSAVILKVQPISVNGMPGYYYLYTFTDAQTGATGAHAHYFLFRGRNMYAIIFQALPQEGFAGLSRVFDQMAESFQTVPDTEPAPEATTTTVG